ncbi:MAG: hypothetical protein QOF71_2456 [Candidatus Eremiobacteraeota bacterium]|jgi:hypothetical protein|nr:hypothetical protein [Candidatus Eremiobacteraeota bacterium]
MTIDFALWNAVVSTVTLLVVAGAAFAALRQIRQLRAQTTLAGLLKVLDDWRDPEFQRTMSYVRHELPKKVQDPAFLEDLDDHLDQVKHPEIMICAWYEQIGSYIKYGLLDERIMMDVASGSTNAMWQALEPVVERMRRTRGPALWENFEYMAARGVLWQRAHPDGCYPRDTPRMTALGGADAYGRAVESRSAEV